jgi:hypothetical protein
VAQGSPATGGHGATSCGSAPLTIVEYCGNNQEIPVGSWDNFFVVAEDCTGAPIGGVNVLFQEPGEDSQGYIRTTDANGLASATNFVSSAAGSYQETVGIVASSWSGGTGFVTASSVPIAAGSTLTFHFTQ